MEPLTALCLTLPPALAFAVVFLVLALRPRRLKIELNDQARDTINHGVHVVLEAYERTRPKSVIQEVAEDMNFTRQEVEDEIRRHEAGEEWKKGKPPA